MISLTSLRPFAAMLLRPSPNHNPRPARVQVIECVVLHATADDGNESGAESWMRNPASQVSAHLHIRRDGTEAQYRALATLAAHYARQGLPLDAFVSHADVALPQGRKSDPANFLWARFYGSVRQRLLCSGAASPAGDRNADPS